MMLIQNFPEESERNSELAVAFICFYIFILSHMWTVWTFSDFSAVMRSTPEIWTIRIRCNAGILSSQETGLCWQRHVCGLRLVRLGGRIGTFFMYLKDDVEGAAELRPGSYNFKRTPNEDDSADLGCKLQAFCGLECALGQRFRISSVKGTGLSP